MQQRTTRTRTGVIGGGKVIHLIDVVADAQGALVSQKARCGANNGMASKKPVYLRGESEGPACVRCYYRTRQ
ncbi:Uncharacterised protein [Mycobacteroides abscessus subsp. abscessus]|nr:Uncharacterised protein [Mycobacteroides abscessus subsp. abscessus]